jgi:hypothetical protein
MVNLMDVKSIRQGNTTNKMEGTTLFLQEGTKFGRKAKAHNYMDE